jgi:hypothetical protein
VLRCLVTGGGGLGAVGLLHGPPRVPAGPRRAREVVSSTLPPLARSKSWFHLAALLTRWKLSAAVSPLGDSLRTLGYLCESHLKLSGAWGACLPIRPGRPLPRSVQLPPHLPVLSHATRAVCEGYNRPHQNQCRKSGDSTAGERGSLSKRSFSAAYDFCSAIGSPNSNRSLARLRSSWAATTRGRWYFSCGAIRSLGN